MRKKITLVLLMLMVTVVTSVFLAACKPDVPDPTPNLPIEIKREDCDLQFGSDGIKYSGILAPIDSAPAVGGAVVATVDMTASGANLNVTASIIKLNIVLRGGNVEVIETSDAIGQVLTLDFSTGFTTSNGKYLTKDVASACVFKFTMPATEDLKYVGANFTITVRVTVTHANDIAV